MAQTTKTKKTAARTRQRKSGHKPRSKAHANRNGNGNGRVHNGNGANGLRPPDPLARDLIAAVASSTGAQVQGVTASEVRVSKAQARKIAVEFGGAMLEATNHETAEHSDDVVVLARAIAEQLDVKGAQKQDLLAAARLHDIGKAAVPIEVIEKPGPLDEAEWTLMRKHTEIGHQILGAVSELEEIARLVRHSHERWDGRGYPDGLAGEDIPLGSRIIFCADAFHAIRSDRPYRAGRTAVASMAEVKRNAGTQFDPEVVRAFEKVARDLRLAPSATAFRRSSRLTALLLMLSIGTAGSAIAASGILGEPSFASSGSGQDASAPSFRSGQMLGISFDDAIKIDRAPGSTSFVFGGGSALGLDQGDSPGQGGRVDAPGGGSRPGDAGSGSGGDAHDSGGDSGGSGSDHPQGGPPGQTGEHPQGGPPGQSGDHPQGGPPGQTGNKPGKGNSGGGSGNSGNSGQGNSGQGNGGQGNGGQGNGGQGNGGQGNSGSGNPHGGPPGQTGNNPGQGGGGPPGNSGSSGGGSGGTGGSSGSPGNSGGNGGGPGGGGPPGQNKPK